MSNKIFTREDLKNIDIAFYHLRKDNKCDEILIKQLTVSKKLEPFYFVVSPIKLIEIITSKIKDRQGHYTIRQILGDHFFDYYVKNKKSLALRDKKVTSIDISKDFIRFNLEGGKDG